MRFSERGNVRLINRLISMKLRRLILEGKQHGYADNYKSGRDDRLEIVRRPYSDYRSQHPPRHLDDRHFDDGYDRYNGRQHFVSFI